MDNDMNDKIKELLIEAIEKTSDDEASKLYIGDEFASNYAELIIKETIKIIQATAAESVDLDRTLVENVSWTVNDIKKHFGVE